MNKQSVWSFQCSNVISASYQAPYVISREDRKYMHDTNGSKLIKLFDKQPRPGFFYSIVPTGKWTETQCDQYNKFRSK